MSRPGRRQVSSAPDARQPLPAYAYSIRTKLTLLVAACTLPALLVSAGLVWDDYRIRRQQIDRDTVLLARGLAASLDRELAGVEAGLRVLATSAELQQGDLAAFQRRAESALPFQMVHNYVMIDRAGQLHMNTLVPHGTPLPATGASVAMRQVFESGKPVLSDLFTGPLTGAPMLALGVPVQRDGQVAYYLGAGVLPERMAAVLGRQVLPDGWIAVVLDSAGTIVARNRDPAQFVGQKAVPALVTRTAAEREGTLESATKEGIEVLIAFSRLPHAGWSVAVGAPKHLLAEELFRSIAWVLAGASLALALGLGLAVLLARRLARSVTGLIEPALALGNGLPVVLAPTRLKEIQAVGQALLQASQRLSRSQHQAQHDALTGLCNRLMFHSLAQRQLALAQRYNSPLALLAIDLDGFKAVNDHFGHAVGDQVLKTVAERIQAVIRASDTAARMGGDEFSVLLTHSSLEGAWRVADQLAQSLNQAFPGGLPNVSASIGVAVYPDAGTSVAALMESADQALYEAKHAGGGCGGIRVSGTS